MSPSRTPGRAPAAGPAAAAAPREGFLFGSVMSTAVRLAYGLGPLILFLEEHGHDVDPLLHAAEIPRFALEEPSSAIRLDQEIAFTRLALRRLGIPEAGLLVGQRYNAPMFGLLGLAASSAPTLLEMQRTVLAYPQLAWGMFETTLWREGDEAVLRAEASIDTGDCTAFFMERDTACAVTLFRDAIDEAASPRLVRFRHPAPRDTAPYREFFRCEVRFGEPVNESRFDVASLALRPRLANEMSWRFFDNQCRRLSESLARPVDFLDLTRSRLRSATPIPSLPDLASSLHLTPRTLQRRLAAEGSSFAGLLQDVRLERAVELLGRRSLRMEEIAWRLGFSDAVAFSRAFKQWTGSAPAHWRQGPADTASLREAAAAAGPRKRAPKGRRASKDRSAGRAR